MLTSDTTRHYGVTVIGGGPAGLAAALAADEAGARVLLIEREGRLGGVLKQCIHDGFGLVRYKEKLTGPEYAWRDVSALAASGVEALTGGFVVKIEAETASFRLTLSGSGGISRVDTRAIVLATGCRERTAKQASVQGSRPAGVMTAGKAQYYVNSLGYLPCRRAVILGSGDIGLIMARRLTLEGASVEGVYESRPEASGLPRNIAQCLEDFDIPLHLSATVTRVFGRERVEAVEIADCDGAMRPITGTERRVDCDGLILSVGLIPENELAESLGAKMAAGVPVHGADCATSVPGVYVCGNAAGVKDLVDKVSEEGFIAGKAAAKWSLNLP
jgi:thioredoxin reductase